MSCESYLSEYTLYNLYKNKEITYNTATFRIKIVINDKTKPFVFLFQGFSSSIVKNTSLDNIDNQKLNSIPNYMEKTFSNIKKYNYVFIVDIYQFWGCIQFTELHKSLQSIINVFKPAKYYCVGQSSGGYMSILFGNLLKATKIIAFTPQTILFGHKFMNDFRHELLERYKKHNFKNKNLSILQPFVSKVVIMLCSCPYDKNEVNQLNKNDKNVKVICVSEQHTHDINIVLTKSQYLNFILNEIN